MVGSVILSMAGASENSVLDRSRHSPGNVREGYFLCRVPKYKFNGHQREGRCSPCRVGVLRQKNPSQNARHHSQFRVWNCQVSGPPRPNLLIQLLCKCLP